MTTDWKKLIAEYGSSGLTKSEFARKRGVSLSSLTYHWRRAKGQVSSSFVPVSREERIELELPGGIVLRVPERSLALVLKALEA